MPIVAVEEPLQEKLGNQAVASLIRLINQSQVEQKRDILEVVEDKFERRLTEEIGKLDVKISETKADLIKWMFIFWIGQVGVILGILFAFFKS
jgi:hypothetical protein